MTPDYLASNGVSYPWPPSPSENLNVLQSSLPPAGTIDPRMLYDNPQFPNSQYDASQSPLAFPERDLYRLSSPIPSSSTSDGAWMGYTSDEATPGPASPVLVYRGAHYSMPGYCICDRGCGRGACIPQRDYDRQRTDPLTEDDLQETILFSVGGKCGYPLADAYKKRYTGLDRRDSKVFLGSKSSISIRLEWLPYEKWTRQIRTLNWRKEAENITLAKLATEVAKRMKIFFEEMEGKEADPSHYQYRVRAGVIDMAHLELVGLKRVAKASYMPHFRLITPSQSQ